MPYADVSQVPTFVKKYPPRIQRMWMKVFNSSHKKYGDERRAFKSANAVVKRNMEKFGANRYGHEGYLRYKIDMFLNKIEG